jgi:uncharacterized protein (DUF885 family)
MSRIPTAVDAIAESYLDEVAALDPLTATTIGIAGHDHEMPDLSPDGLVAMSQLRQRTLAAARAATVLDDSDRITVAELIDQLTVAELIRDTGAEESALNNIHSPLQTVRDVFDLMPTESTSDWETIATRLAAIPAAIEGYVASLRLAAGRGDVSPQRQVQAGIIQAGRNVGSEGFFATFTAAAPALPASLRADLDRAASRAGQVYEELITVLRDELLPLASAVDACGPERYALHSRQFLGTQIDLAETYQWGQDEVARTTAEIVDTCARILPGATLTEVIDFLDSDPARKLVGTDALQAWMQGKSDQAVADLGASHFDIPEPIRTLECRIAPTASGGIYYTGPSEDFSRPGRMWWSVPAGVTEFATWKQLTTVYHEGVPGHHLQIAQTLYRAERLNRWRRMGSWTSGHGEGWACCSRSRCVRRASSSTSACTAVSTRRRSPVAAPGTTRRLGSS